MTPFISVSRRYLILVVGLAFSFISTESAASPASILDFESDTDWSMVEGAGPAYLSSESSYGQYSLEVAGNGFRRLRSVPMSTPGAPENTVWLDVEPTQIPENWEGVGLAVRIGSLELWWADLGTNSIVGLVPGEFSTLAFTVPEAVRAALNSSYADLEVFISVNTSAPIRLDNLRFASMPSGNEGPNDEPNSGNLVCDPERSDREVTAVEGDLKDLWAGREDAATGKRTGPRPNVGLTFSAPIDAARLSARFSPVSCSGYPIAAIPQNVASYWPEVQTNTESTQLPGGFGIVTSAWVDGVSQSDGAIAAGLGVRLSSFSVNEQSSQGTAIATSSLDLTNGSVFGDILTPSSTTLDQSVSLFSGSLQVGSLPSFDEGKARLTQLSVHLSELSSNGTVEFQYDALVLTGTSPGLNVFSVQADQLTQASSIRFEVPDAASVLVNVDGKDIRFVEQQISLETLPVGRLLWNASDADSVLIKNIAFVGSLLASGAVVDVRQGSFAGTLVAKSVTGAYNHFIYVPLQTAEMFGANSALTVNLKPARSLEPGCEYRFLVQSVVPLDGSGSCLEDPVIINFIVAAD